MAGFPPFFFFFFPFYFFDFLFFIYFFIYNYYTFTKINTLLCYNLTNFSYPQQTNIYYQITTNI